MLGEWIRLQREQRGWSQSELARRAGLSATAINLLESNRRRQPQSDTAQKLARAFDLSVEEMYRAAYGETIPDGSDAELREQWERLPNWQKRLALMLLDANLRVQQELAGTQSQQSAVEHTDPELSRPAEN